MKFSTARSASASAFSFRLAKYSAKARSRLSGTSARQDVQRFFFHSPGTIQCRRDGELFVTMSEITFVILEIREFLVHRLAHGRERAIHANDGIGADLDYLTNRICRRHACLYRRIDELSRSRVEIDIGATMTEMDSHVRITLRCFDHRRVERRPAD